MAESRKEIILRELEWKKCSSDPKYFLQTYGKMWSKQGGEPIDWNLWECQKDALDNMLNKQKLIFLKTRQLGLSWTAIGFALHQMLFKQNFKVYYRSISVNDVVEQFERFEFIYANLPEWMRERIQIGGTSTNRRLKSNTKQIQFSNGSSIKAIASGKASGHGSAPSLLILDEFARDDKATMTWRSALPSLSGEGKVFIISTANGPGNKYHELWNTAKSGTGDMVPIFYPASAHPLYTEQFLEQMKEEFAGDDAGFYEAYPMTPEQAFMTSAKCPFNGEKINWQLRHIEREKIKPTRGILAYAENGSVEFIDKSSGPYEIWDKPCRGDSSDSDFRHQYTIGADVAQGLYDNKGDYSVAVVVDVTEMKVVALYRKRIQQEYYSTELKMLALYYNNAWLAVESNAYSDVILNDLKANYINLYRREVRDNLWDKPTMKPGFHTNAQSKVRIITQLRRAFSDSVHPIYIPSSTILGEMITYEQTDKGKLEASKGNHDDCVMALAIAIEAMNTMPDIDDDDVDYGDRNITSFSY